MNSQDKFEIFNDFLDQYIYYLCAQCCRHEKFIKLHNQVALNRRVTCHHDGLILHHITPIKELDHMCHGKFLNDLEHGLFHGVMVAFVGYVLVRFNLKNALKDLECFFASATLHDFLKSNGYDQSMHDKALKDYYPHLLPETYDHSTNGDYDKLLIAGDRIELRRYDDYLTWVDQRYHKLISSLNPDLQQLLDFFYNVIRPTLKGLYNNRYALFIRHGIEHLDKVNYKTDVRYPPSGSFYELEKGYPIEIDRVPFGTDALPSDYYSKKVPTWTPESVAERRKNTKRLLSFCSNHSGGPLHNFNTVKGFIPAHIFKKQGGKIIHSGMRDHLYADSNIHPKNWTFLYQGVDAENKQVKQLIENKYRVMPQETVILFFNLVKLFTDRLIALNIM